MHTLPQQVDTARYWQELYRQPLPFWQAALDRIMGWAHRSTAAREEREIMARAMLYYPDDFARLIQIVPGAAQCQGWSAMAAVFWRLTAP
jgi:hypothetical protein